MRKLLFYFLSICFIFAGCKNETIENLTLSSPKEYAAYISSFTTGMISTHSSIDVALNPEQTAWKSGSTIKENLFTFSPSVKGKTELISGSILRFTPDKPLEENQKYIIELDIDKATGVKTNLPNFVFFAHTISQNYAIEVTELQSLDSENYLINATIISNDNTTIDELKKILTAKQDQANLDIAIHSTTENSSTSFDVIIKNIKRKKVASSLEISLNTKVLNNEIKKQLDIDIPVLEDFAFHSYRIPALDDQTIWINFSEPLLKNQNFDGLISIENHENKLTYTTSGNILKIYSETPFHQDIQVDLHPGITSADQKKTIYPTRLNIQFGLQKPQVRLINSGNILPSSNNLKINFQSVGLNKIDVKVYQIYENNILQFLQSGDINENYYLYNVADPIVKTTIDIDQTDPKTLNKLHTYALDLASIISVEPGAMYCVELDYKKQYAIYPCLDNQTKLPEETQENFYTKDDQEDTENNYYYYHYNWDEKDDPCKDAYYYYKDPVSITVLASDLGIITKQTNDGQYVTIVTNLLTALPVENSTVELYSYSQQLIASAKTDNQGIVKMTIRDKTPYFVIAKDKDNTSYLKIDQAQSLSMSNFDIDGTTLIHGINGYIYTERGVWRPSDSIYLGFILNDQTNPLPEGHPIKVTLADPMGKNIAQLTQSKNKNNHYVFKLKTASDAPTGNYIATVNVGGVLFSKTIKIETIKPNRLKIKNTVETDIIQGNKITPIDFNVTWLTGSIAADLKANVEIQYIPIKTTFNKFLNFKFENQLSRSSVTLENMFDGKTDAQGNFTLQLNPNDYPKNAGLLKAVFITKVYEKSGDMSTDVVAQTISPFKSYVGISPATPNKYGYYQTTQDLDFKIVTITLQQNPIESNVTARLYKREGYWWWSQNNSGISNYSTSSYHKEVWNQEIKTNQKGLGSLSINIDQEDYGSYELVVTDNNSGHISSYTFYVESPYWNDPNQDSQNKKATSLALAVDKQQYNVEDKIKLSFPSSLGARALISIENGSGIISTQWVDTKQNETTVEIVATKQMSPNVYINVSMIQPHSFTLNNAPIRLYGVVPISISDEKTILKPVIDAPKELKPEQEFTLKVSEKNGRSMDYTIAIVEDGLLDLTRFKTPNAWDLFNSKIALGVRTFDLYDQVIGAYGGSIQQIFSIGGDEHLAAGQAKKANRFKPVALFEGPFQLENGKNATHKIKLPKYIGSVRIMVIASNSSENAFGSSEKTLAVKSPLMVLGTLPRRAVPTEKITLPVSVFVMDDKLKEVEIEVKTDSKIKINGSSKQHLTFTNLDEKIAYFNLEIEQQTGISNIEIIAKSKSETATYNVEMDIINPNPITVRNKSIVLKDATTQSIDWDNFGMPGTNKATLELSSFPGLNIGNRANYLITYPHGCTEQITSAALGQLFIPDLIKTTDKQNTKIQENINSALKTLSQRQFSTGGFKYWDSSTSVDDWATSYAGHFFLLAQKKGYALPVGSLNLWLNHQKHMALKWQNIPEYKNDFNQAYRLYTLALAGKPEIALMNRLAQIKDISINSKLRLAAAYALIGETKQATTLVGNTPLSPTNELTYKNSYGSFERDIAMALQTSLLLDPNANQTHQYALELGNTLAKNYWMSTQTTAYSLMAMAEFIGANKTNTTIEVDLIQDDVKTVIKQNTPALQKELKTTNNATQNVELTNKQNATVYANISYQGILGIDQEVAFNEKLHLTTVFTDLTGKEIYPKQIIQSTEFKMYIKVTNLTNIPVTNIALTQLVPSGWEIVNLRYTDQLTDNQPWDHNDIRDDRSNIYFSLSAKSAKVFSITLNASYLGKYYLPGSYVQAMYDNTYSAREAGRWVEVIEQ